MGKNAGIESSAGVKHLKVSIACCRLATEVNIISSSSARKVKTHWYEKSAAVELRMLPVVKVIKTWGYKG